MSPADSFSCVESTDDIELDRPITADAVACFNIATAIEIAMEAY